MYIVVVFAQDHLWVALPPSLWSTQFSWIREREREEHARDDKNGSERVICWEKWVRNSLPFSLSPSLSSFRFYGKWKQSERTTRCGNDPASPQPFTHTHTRILSRSFPICSISSSFGVEISALLGNSAPGNKIWLTAGIQGWTRRLSFFCSPTLFGGGSNFALAISTGAIFLVTVVVCMLLLLLELIVLPHKFMSPK